MPVWRVITIDLRALIDRNPSEGRDEIFLDKASAKAAQALRKNPHTRVSVHFCSHAAGEPSSEWYSCRDDVRAQYEEM